MPTAPYDLIADWYDATVRAGWGGHEGEGQILSALSELIGDVGGKDLCDLGCGQGAFTRWLARAGAKVVGVDISERLLEIARREERDDPLGIAYLQDDAQHLASLSDHSFDGVMCT